MGVTKFECELNNIFTLNVSADLTVSLFYAARCNIGYDTQFTACFFLFLYVYMVTDFSARALQIGVKLCTAVWPHLRQVFSYFFWGGGIAPGMAEIWASTGAIWRDMLLAEALVHPFLEWELVKCLFYDRFHTYEASSFNNNSKQISDAPGGFSATHKYSQPNTACFRF